jgi:hypothetical protein
MQTSLLESAVTARAKAVRLPALTQELTANGKRTASAVVSGAGHEDWEGLRRAVELRKDAFPAPNGRIVAHVLLLSSMVGLRGRSWGRLLPAQAAWDSTTETGAPKSGGHRATPAAARVRFRRQTWCRESGGFHQSRSLRSIPFRESRVSQTAYRRVGV